MVDLANSMTIVTFLCRYYGSRQHEFINRSAAPTGPDEVEGSVVEPVQPRNFMAPALAFFEPPPLYSENTQTACPGMLERHRYEPPPPYSVEDHDTAGLIMNECAGSQIPVPAVNNAAVHIGHPLPRVYPANPSHIAAQNPATNTEAMDTAVNAINVMTYQQEPVDKDVVETTPLTDNTTASHADGTVQASSQEIPLVSANDTCTEMSARLPEPQC